MVTNPIPLDRINNARKKRHDAHDTSIKPPDAMHQNYDPVGITSFTKGLQHNEKGEVNPTAFNQFLEACQDAIDDSPDYRHAVGYFKNINTPMSKKRERWVNPVGGLAYDSQGIDSFNKEIPPAPQINELNGAAEIAELYWMSLIRDINFTDYDEPSEAPEVQEAINDLNSDRFKNYKFIEVGWTRDNTPLSPKTLFRGTNKGDDVGPYISQFLLRGNDDFTLGNSVEDGYVKFGTATIDQRHVVAISEVDYMTDTRSWLDVQDGYDPEDRRDRLVDPKHTLFQKNPRFIRNLRDLATYVHFDALYQAYLTACIYMLNAKDKDGKNLFHVNPSFPYDADSKQHGFGTYGEPHILSLVCEVATRALKAVWLQKWFVHRRLRPEAFGGLIHYHKTEGAPYHIHESILNSPVLEKIFRKNQRLNKEFNRKNHDDKIDGTYLLPQAFIEGSPMHPSYGAGHATVAGACVTILKAWFEDLEPIPGQIIEANGSGSGLKKYKGNDTENISVHGELNKLAANVAIGRNGAGVHYRSDYTASLILGEKVAISILKELKDYYLPETVEFKFIPFFKDSEVPI